MSTGYGGGERVIVIAGGIRPGDLRRATDLRGLLLFDSIEAFDRWRALERASRPLEDDVTRALLDFGVSRDALPEEIRIVLERVAAGRVVPRVRDLLGTGLSARTFYRRWQAVIGENPKRVLARVRARHAIRLTEAGLPPKEAAFRAGFPSASAMRKAIAAADERTGRDVYR